MVAVCAVGCDFATIQGAIDDAGTSTGDVIWIADAVHTEQSIEVSKDVTIQGQGAAYTIVQAHERPGQATDRVFHIVEGATVTIQALTIRHGSPTVDVRSGGGILNNGTLTMRFCVVRDNLANCGGGILNVRGTLTMTNCTVRDNMADGKGPPGFGCGSGGAIKLEDKSEATLENCTLSDNHGEGKGGALHVSCTSKATLTNCTLSGNQARGRGGGIHAKGELTLVHCTIAGNSAQGVVRGQGIGDQAGGGLSVRGKGILWMSNTLIGNNPNDGDCTLEPNVTVAANSYNLVEDGSCDPAYTGDPNLGRLRDNGGDTQTHALLAGSPAIDAIPIGACPIRTDQRGAPRPGGDTGTGAMCDVGAFERPPPETQADDETVPTPSPDWLYHKGQDFEIRYPPYLQATALDRGVRLRHAIPLEHSNPCFGWGSEVQTLDQLVDFSVDIEVVDKALAQIVTENGVSLDHLYEAEIIVGSLQGYIARIGAEGCGQTLHLFPLGESRTLLMTRAWIAEWNTGSAETYLALPGVIPPAEEERLFHATMATLHLTPD